MKKVLDACCGSKMFWFDKQHKDVLYMDIRQCVLQAKDSSKKLGYQNIVVNPDIVADFTNIPFADNTFYHVVFDPPHLNSVRDTAWLAKKYGRLGDDWKELIGRGFVECMRVLKVNGTLIMKWNEHDIKLSAVLQVIEATGHRPMYGHTTGKHGKTIWMAFLKQ